LGYQIWLTAVLTITGDSHTAVAVYAAFLSVITPWLWYRWMRECVPERALEGYAILALAPDWIKIYSVFMQETLLLPLLGLALWLSWKAQREVNFRADLWASLAWAGALVTKASALPIFVIVWAWVARTRLQQAGRKAMLLACLAGAVTIPIYSLTACKIYCRTGIPGARHMLYDEIYFESGAKLCRARFLLPQTEDPAQYSFRRLEGPPAVLELPMDCGSPSAYLPQFEPFSAWESGRRGDTFLLLDRLQISGHRVRPHLPARLRWTGENVLFFLFGQNWPGHFFVAQVGENMRWIWAPMALAVLLSAWFQPEKRREILTVLCLVSLFIFVFQQSFSLEGRHRMPWEGLDLAAYLSLFRGTSGVDRKGRSW
jgi:hypothetical protein